MCYCVALQRSDRDALKIHCYILVGCVVHLPNKPDAVSTALSARVEFLYVFLSMHDKSMHHLQWNVLSHSSPQLLVSWEGGWWNGCSVACSDLSSAGSQSAGWNKHVSLAPDPGGSISEATTVWH